MDFSTIGGRRSTWALGWLILTSCGLADPASQSQRQPEAQAQPGRSIGVTQRALRTPLLEANFAIADARFQYIDDAFGTNAPDYADGSFIASNGIDGGSLRIDLGGRDNERITDMSGAFSTNFELAAPARIEVSLRYELVLAADYESNEESLALIQVDSAPRVTLNRVVGNGNGGSETTTGIRQEVIDLGTLAAGSHQLKLGGFNNQKTFNNEQTRIVFDDISITQIDLPDSPTPPSPDDSEILVDAPFDTDADGLRYVDDAFRGTSAPAYADGVFDGGEGLPGGALRVNLGGIDGADIVGMSGGWIQEFTLTEARAVKVAFDFRLQQNPDYENDEFTDALLSVDGVLFGPSNQRLARVQGNGNGGLIIDTDWRPLQVDVGVLSAGVHRLALGGFNNKKTLQNESSVCFFDNLKITASTPVDPDGNVLLEAHFGDGTDGFDFVPDAFEATIAPEYALGSHTPSDGRSGGGLKIQLGGLDDARVVGISGGFRREFDVTASVSDAVLSFRFNLAQSPNYESNELSRVFATLDGELLHPQETPVALAEISGDGNGGAERSSLWRLVEIPLGNLSLGKHTLTLGGFNNQKTFLDELTTILLDDVRIQRVTPADPGAVSALVNSLSFARFKQNILDLADFGDRSQLNAAGSPSYTNAVAFIRDQLEAAGYAVDAAPYLFQGSVLRESIYVTKVGTVFPDRMVIVSAHLDGRGGGGGADDDASGSSLVLEAARAMATASPEVSVRFVFWNNEESGLEGSRGYANARAPIQGNEQPLGSGLFPEPSWLGVIQHDMILFDHGLPVQRLQHPNADIDVEFQRNSLFATEAAKLAAALGAGNRRHATDYPAEVTDDMSNTDSVSFQDFTASVSVRENRRRAEIGRGANPNWHERTDVPSTYSDADFRLGFNALQTTLGTVAELSRVK